MLDKRMFCGFCGDPTVSSSLSILLHILESWVVSSALSTAVRKFGNATFDNEQL